MNRPSPKNISTLLVCVGLVLSVAGYVIAYFLVKPATATEIEPTEQQAAVYQQTAIYCVTLFLGGGVAFIVGLSMKSFLFLKRMYDKNTLLAAYWKGQR